MSIAISDVRTRCVDSPTPRPLPSETPELLGVGDGSTTTFQLTKVPYTGSALLVGQGITIWQNTGTGWTQVSSSNYTLQNGYQVVFNSAPAAATSVGARYYYTTFSDSDLTSVLNTALQEPVCTSDPRTLDMCQYIVIGMLLMNRELLINYHRGDANDDPAILAASLKEVRASLEMTLFGKERPGSNIPSVVVTYQDYVPYTPQR